MEGILELYHNLENDDVCFRMNFKIPQAKYNEFKEELKNLVGKYDDNPTIDISHGEQEWNIL